MNPGAGNSVPTNEFGSLEWSRVHRVSRLLQFVCGFKLTRYDFQIGARLHLTAALALVGWYLLGPPLLRGQDRKLHIQENVPLSHWEIMEFADTEQTCELLRGPGKRLGPVLSAQKAASICIANDDPRLKSK
jgi:hypothetical protein